METLTSKEVSILLEKRHDNLLRDIRKYIKSLGAEKDNYFIDSKYKDKAGKERFCFDITLKGCEYLANRIIGEKAITFREKYLELLQPKEKKAYTLKEVAKEIGVSLRSVQRYVSAGKIKTYEDIVYVPTQRVLVSEEELKKFKEAR